MKRNDAEQIGKLIQQYLRQESLESPLNEQRLLDAWPQVLGPAASYTSNLYIRSFITKHARKECLSSSPLIICHY